MNRTEVDRKLHLLAGEANGSSASDTIESVVKLRPSTGRQGLQSCAHQQLQKRLLGGKCEQELGHEEGKY